MHLHITVLSTATRLSLMNEDELTDEKSKHIKPFTRAVLRVRI